MNVLVCAVAIAEMSWCAINIIKLAAPISLFLSLCVSSSVYFSIFLLCNNLSHSHRFFAQFHAISNIQILFYFIHFTKYTNPFLFSVFCCCCCFFCIDFTIIFFLVNVKSETTELFSFSYSCSTFFAVVVLLFLS